MRLYEAHKAAAEFLYQAPLTVKKFNGPSEHDLYRHPTSTIKTRDGNRKSYPMRLTSKEEYDTWKALNGWSDDRVRDKWRLVPYPHPTNIRVVRDSWDLLRIAADMRQEAHQKHFIKGTTTTGGPFRTHGSRAGQGITNMELFQFCLRLHKAYLYIKSSSFFCWRRNVLNPDERSKTHYQIFYSRQFYSRE